MNNKNEMSILILVLKILAWVGGITTSLIAIFYYLDSGYYGQDLCFETKCVKAFFNIFYSIPEFVDFYLKIVVAVITILGVFYALSNYLNSTTTSRLNVPGLTHQCLYFEQPHTFEQILFIQTAEPALVGHAQIT